MKPVYQQSQKGFPVRLFVECSRAIRWTYRRPEAGVFIQLFNFGGNIEETLGPQKEAVTRAWKSFCYPQETMQLGMRVASAKPKIPGPAFSVEAARNCYGLEQGRFPRAILPNEECDCWMEFKYLQWPHRRQ